MAVELTTRNAIINEEEDTTVTQDLTELAELLAYHEPGTTT